LMPCSNSSAGPTTSPLVIIRTLQQADHSNFQLYNYLTSEIEFLIFFQEKTNTRYRPHQVCQSRTSLTTQDAFHYNPDSQ
jgi:hypothetical protein